MACYMSPETPEDLAPRTNHSLIRVFALVLVVLSLTAALPQAAPPATAPHVVTTEDFRNYLLATTWSWRRPDGPKEKLEFLPDGTARHTHFIGKYEVTKPREVELSLGNKKAKLMFDENYIRYGGLDFDGVRPIEGWRQTVAAPSPSSSDPAKPPAQVAPPRSSLSAQSIAGAWHWFTDQIVTIQSDGTFLAEGGRNGTWRLRPGSSREYILSWDGGRFEDYLSLSPDGRKLSGRSKKKEPINAERIR